MTNHSASYEGNEPFLFVSYAHKDSAIVLPLVEGLQTRGFRVWYDERISDGVLWQRVIAEHLKKSRCVLAFVSQASLDSPNCRREINYAVNLSERYSDSHASPIPVYLDNAQMDAEMEMILMPLQSRYYYKYSGPEEFLDSLEASDALQICRKPAAVEWDTIDFADGADAVAEETPEGWYQRGKKLYEEKNYEEAAAWYRKAAQQGHAQAGCQLGLCYDMGYGVPQNYAEAIRWYRIAAQQGDAEAKFNLGVSYYYGQGVVQDMAEAARWYRAAAEQGYADAQLNLALCYEFGVGVPLDKAEAAMWFRLAAEQGAVLAQRNLGLCYEEGEGVRQDLQEALKWYRRAKANGHDTADEDIARCEAKMK